MVVIAILEDIEGMVNMRSIITDMENIENMEVIEVMVVTVVMIDTTIIPMMLPLGMIDTENANDIAPQTSTWTNYAVP